LSVTTAAVTTAAVTTAVAAGRAGLGRLAGTFTVPGTLSPAGLMFARLGGLCLPATLLGIIRMFVGLRTVVPIRLGPTIRPRLALAVASCVAVAAVVMTTVAAVAVFTRSVSGPGRRRRRSSDYDEARREDAGRSGKACPRRDDVSSPSCPVSAHNNPTTLQALTLNLLSA
jgi:hypothetical protein